MYYLQIIQIKLYGTLLPLSDDDRLLLPVMSATEGFLSTPLQHCLAPSPGLDPTLVFLPQQKLINCKNCFRTRGLKTDFETRCRPSKGRRCIPDVVLKNEGSMGQTCRSINVHVCSKHRYLLRPTCMFMDRMIAPINVHSIS